MYREQTVGLLEGSNCRKGCASAERFPVLSFALCLLLSVSFNEVPQYYSVFLQGREEGNVTTASLEAEEQDEALRLLCLQSAVPGSGSETLLLQKRAY